jgi:hypothetical protein
MREQEETQKAVMDEFHKPLKGTAELLMRLVMQLVTHAAERGQSEVQIYRFLNAMWSYRGRRINNSGPGGTRPWRPPQVRYELWLVSSGRSASISRLNCSSIPAACPVISASFSAGSNSHLGRFLRSG